jgi:uroporphyrinogen decarboxylase
MAQAKTGGKTPVEMSNDELKARVARFEQRVREAQLASGPTKERVKKAIQRKSPDRCPTWGKRLSMDVVVKYGDDLADLFCEFPDDIMRMAPYEIFIGHQPADRPDKVDPVVALTRDAEWNDEWGTRWMHSAGGTGAHQVAPAIPDWSQLDDYLAHRIPKADAPGRFDPVLADLASFKAAKYMLCRVHLLLYERLNCLRGAENVLMDLYTNETELRRLADAILEYDLGMIRNWARLGADGLFFSEDWGMQTGLMISPEMWRRLFKPYYVRILDEAHRHGLDVILHSCGNVMDIVGDFIDIGLDALDPIQPTAMDIREVARRFGGRISFQGAVNVREMLDTFSPRQVKDMVRRTIDTLATPFGGGLILAPDNVLTPELPLENIRAMVEAFREGWT